MYALIKWDGLNITCNFNEQLIIGAVLWLLNWNLILKCNHIIYYMNYSVI